MVEPTLRDVFHAAAAARAGHAELALYATLVELAEALELPEAARLLRQNLDEDTAALERVEQIGGRLMREVAHAR